MLALVLGGLLAPAAPATATPVLGPRVVAHPTAAWSGTGPEQRRVAPVPGPPVRPYVAPPHEYGPGHRGVDLPAVAGAPVGSPADGTVTFAGPVAGRGVLVVAHAQGTLTSLEPVEALVAVGTRVVAGEPVAAVASGPQHAGCPGSCLHWGVRVDGRYVDPWWWLGRTREVRLLPLAGAPPPPARASPGRWVGPVSAR